MTAMRILVAAAYQYIFAPCACVYARHVSACDVYFCMCAFLHFCMCACKYECMHVCMYACIHVCMHACLHSCMHVFKYVCMYVCISERV